MPHSPSPLGTAAPDARPTQPLTEAQLGLWYAQRLDPDNPIFNTAQSVDIRGELDLAALAWAVSTAMAEAQGLTVGFAGGDDGPRQHPDAARTTRLETIDLRPCDDPMAAAVAAMAQDGGTPLDPTRAPLVRQLLFILGQDHSIWYQRIHHLVVDGYGTGLLTRRICELYGARVTGSKPGPALAPYAGLLAEDAAYRASQRRDDDRRFWLAAFSGAPVVEGLAPGPAITGRYWLRRGTALDAVAPAALLGLADSARVPWPDVLVGLVAAYLRRHLGDGPGDGLDEGSGEDGPAAGAIVVGVPTMNRFGSVAARVPAMVMNILPVQLTIDEEVALPRFLGAVSQQLQRARRHGRYRSEQLRRDLGLLGGSRRLYGALINVLPFDQAPVLPGCATRLEVLGTGPVDDLTVTLRADAKARGLRLEIDANPELYTEAEVADHVARLAGFLAAAVTAPRLAEVATLTPAEHHHWTVGVNDTAHPTVPRTLTQLIEATMARTPQAVALSFAGQSLSYAALDRASAGLAGRLATAGVVRGDIVGVALPRSPELVIALVAILRAGAAYLPIDLDHPPARIALTLDSARPRLVIGNRAAAECLPSGPRLLRLDAPAEVPPAARPGFAAAGPARSEDTTPDDAAYVIYTSGSTGVPKGVVIEHRAIVNRLEWMRQHYGFGPDDRILQKTPASFDVSVWEFFLPLITGATLVLAPPQAHKDPAWLARIFRTERITTAHFVPSMLAQFLAEPAAAGIALRRVFCSGEALPASLRDRFHQVIAAELHNLYGPTEAAVDVTWWPAPAGDRSQPVPIGFPVWNTALYVLDRRLRPVPPGVTGDLYIAGCQLARGYLGQPELTDQRFIADPFGAPGARIYRTGDVARWRCDGALVFLGRSDHQVKLRGLRIELGEIEAALRAIPTVGQAAVIARQDRPGDQRLVGYVVAAAAGQPIDPVGLAGELAVRLPDYMIPTLVVLPALPVTANGKLDRAALPAPGHDRAAGDRPTASETERRLAGIFAEVLGLNGADTALGGGDDFFSLGGHSLLAAQAMRRIRAAWPVPLGLGALFSCPTVAQLARQIDEACQTGGQSAMVALGREGLSTLLPLVEGEAASLPPVFFVHPAGGIAWCYLGLARALGPGRAVYGLQARGLDPAQPLPGDLTTLAADYLAQIRAIRPRGPYHLAGWSVGGIIAHEIAVQFAATGERVGVLAVLDAYPCDCWRDEPDPDEGAALKALMQIAGVDPAVYAGQELTRAGAIALLRAAGHPLSELPDPVLSGIIRVVENNNRLVRRHRHRRHGGTLLHFRAALDHLGGDLTAQRWGPYVEGLDVHDIPARHGQLIGAEATRRIAPVLRARLAECDLARDVLQPSESGGRR